ncbi:MAG: hypothetical protein MJK14_17705, partial [Rivularia sp. ALOHA_DT_140]|nr:hypothetical protein [Rivularia sp. ALOHA_DT_140]
GDYAEMLLSAVSMNLLMQDLDISEGLEISLVSQLDEMQWEVLSPRIQARINLECENQQALRSLKIESISAYYLDEFGTLLLTPS